MLANYLDHYAHNLLVINVKEDGLEEEILMMIERKSIKSYFFLDQAYPTIIKNSNKNIISSGRLSKFESIDTIKNMSNKISWVWVDYYENKFPISLEQLGNVKEEHNLRFCLVSPELHGYDLSFVDEYKENIEEFLPYMDAVCTKHPSKWR